MGDIARRSRLIMGVSPGEFLVVAALVGALGALAIRESMLAIPRVMQTEALSLAVRSKVHWTEVWANEGRVSDPVPFVDPSPSLAGPDVNYVVPAEGDSEGTANFLFGKKSGQLHGDIVSVRPAFSAGGHAIVWVCGHAPAPNGFTVRGENRTTVPRDELLAACRVRT